MGYIGEEFNLCFVNFFFLFLLEKRKFSPVLFFLTPVISTSHCINKGERQKQKAAVSNGAEPPGRSNPDQ